VTDRALAGNPFPVKLKKKSKNQISFSFSFFSSLRQSNDGSSLGLTFSLLTWWPRRTHKNDYLIPLSLYQTHTHTHTHTHAERETHYLYLSILSHPSSSLSLTHTHTTHTLTPHTHMIFFYISHLSDSFGSLSLSLSNKYSNYLPIFLLLSLFYFIHLLFILIFKIQKLSQRAISFFLFLMSPANLAVM